MQTDQWRRQALKFVRSTSRCLDVEPMCLDSNLTDFAYTVTRFVKLHTHTYIYHTDTKGLSTLSVVITRDNWDLNKKRTHDYDNNIHSNDINFSKNEVRGQ